MAELYPFFKDIYGQQEAVETFKTLVEQIKLIHIYKLYNQSPLNGILLNGPKGVGKTSLVKALVNELEVGEVNSAMFQLSYVDIANAFIDRPIENMRAAFKFIDDLITKTHVILFIDEIDVMFPSLSDNTHESDKKRVNVFLEWLDGGLQAKKSITVIGATNNEKAIHSALLRPGRFDKVITFNNLQSIDIYNAIFSHLKILVPDCKFEVDYSSVSSELGKGYNGADATYIANQIIKYFVNKHLELIKTQNINFDDITRISETKPPIEVGVDLFKKILSETKTSAFEKKRSIGFIDLEI